VNIILAFLCSFIISTAFTFAVVNATAKEEDVLGYTTQLPLSSPLPSPTPTALPSTATPKPTVRTTPKPTITPTPVPTAAAPTSTPDVWAPANVEHWFAQYAGQYGVDKNLLERIANCESHFNPSARNGDYVGIFQFATTTWISYRTQMGMDTNPDLRTNAEESIRTGAFLVSKRGSAPWPSCV
jgi:hypothetical protein